jgi:hypothetical protein
MSTELTLKASTVVRVLEMSMQSVTVPDISERLDMPKTQVRATQNAHGYPNERTMLDQVRQLLPLKDQEVTFDTDLTPEPPRDDTAPARPAAPVAPRPAATPPPPIRVEKVDDLQTFLDGAAKHERPAIANEAERIIARIARLREALDEVDADTKRLAEIAQLEKRLAELRGAKAARSRQHGTFPCDQCGRVSTTGAGLSAHKRGAHGGAS